MKKYFCITIDVEPDCSTSWHRSNPLTFENVEAGIGRILTSLFERCGARPTYLISPEVLAHEPSVKLFKSLADCELGTHLHSEYIEPQVRYADAAGTQSSEFPCNLPADIEAAKITAITELFQKQFGYRPVSYRAARFGAGQATFAALIKNGYKVDTSVTPGINWQKKGGPDFRDWNTRPTWIEKGNLLEIPVTIGGKRLAFLPDRWYFYRWLRPSIMSGFEMRRLVDEIAAAANETICLNMMFHSMEVIPKASPYVRTIAEQVRYLDRLEKVIEYMCKKGFEAKTLSQVYDAIANR